MIVNAITAFLGTLVDQIMKPLRELLGATLLSTPDLTEQADIKRLWTGSLGLTGGIYVLFVTAGGLTVMAHETLQSRYALKQIAPRLLIGIIAAAASLTVLGKAISLANALSYALLGTDASDAGKGLIERAIPFALFGGHGMALYVLLIAILTIFLILAVLVGYIVRIAVIAVIAVSGPLALSCHAHPVTDPVARMWWRALAGCLTIQVAQSVTLIVALKLFFAPGATLLGFPKPTQLGTLLAGLALFWILFKIPGWCTRVIFRATPLHPQLPASLRMLQSVALWRLINRYVPGAAVLRRRPGGGGRGGRPGGPGGRGTPPGPPRGGGNRPGRPTGGRGGGRLPVPGGVAGIALRRGRALVARAGSRASSRAPAATAATGGQVSTPIGLRTARPGGAPTSPARGTAGPRSVIHPSQARRTRQLTLPIPAKRVPARPGRPTQLRLPVTAQRVPRITSSKPLAGATPTAPQSSGVPAPVRRVRQMALPVPAARVRTRPVRPVQLRLPLEPPAPPSPSRR
ncbi:hypothetical protein [Streptomyces sp. WM6378]|uniref:hypothetical protein n=1 Tax=Streptomyces sp. WM6378 TaxID=1415557 RepID=UPI0006B030DE|nr:hypothetical protein [Streptomyces sp. WM6378]KOU38744.1 hypothetical protein ADK54_27775 [Streptomyces sp. WM6378]